MALKKFALKVTEKDRGKRLDHILAEWLPGALSRPLSKGKTRKLIVAGAVYLNGKRIRIASKAILPGARLEVFVDLGKVDRDGPGNDVSFSVTPDRVLYEDEFLIAINKPAGLPTQPTLDESRNNLFAAVKQFLAKRDAGAVSPYVGLHHRLDRDTSGVVCFTKQVAANAGLAEAFSKHTAVKTYYALTIRPRFAAGSGFVHVPAHWTVKNHLGKAPGPGKKARFTSVRSGGDFAHTDFVLLDEFNDALLVQAQPRTGRTHQIRVHLAEAGMPILGDSFYGYRPSRVVSTRIMLHAARLTLPHPITKEEISIESPLPEDFLKCLEALKS